MHSQRHRVLRTIHSVSVSFPVFIGSMGQSGSSLRATAGKHLAAISGGHSLAETVLLGTLALLGLIGTEHL